MKSFILSNKIVPDLLAFDRVLRSSFVNFDGLNKNGDEIEVLFKEEIDQTIIDAVELITPPQINPIDQVKIIIARAIAYGNNLISEFAAENVLMGITQQNKTKMVADYLGDVTRYIATGSLYEVVNEINRLQQSGIPPELAPFVTNERMEIFKNKILTYLGQ